MGGRWRWGGGGGGFLLLLMFQQVDLQLKVGKLNSFCFKAEWTTSSASVWEEAGGRAWGG